MHAATWLDWVILILLLTFTIRGILRGTIAQVFAFLGVAAGIWIMGFVSRAVGHHWEQARPTFVYGFLRWLVAVLAGLAVASLFQWWGEKLGEASHKGPLGTLDRMGGGLLGLLLGALLSAALALVAVDLPTPAFAREAALRGVVSPVLLAGGARASAWHDEAYPGGRWLHRQFETAARRVEFARRAARAR